MKRKIGEEEGTRDQKRTEREKITGTRMPSRCNKKPAADVSDQDEEEGGMVKEVRRRKEKRCRMTREMLNAVCYIHGQFCQWICCDNCDVWYHTHCTVANPDRIPDIFYCFQCV